MRFFERIRRLEEIVAGGPSGCDYARDIRPLLLELPSVGHFYALIEDPAWLPVLEEGDCFAESPVDMAGFEASSLEARLSLETMRISLLSRLAERAPSDVLGILRSLPAPEGYAARRQYVGSLAVLVRTGTAGLEPLVSSEIKWLGGVTQIDPLLTKQYQELISALVDQHAADAETIASRMLEPLPEVANAKWKQHGMGFRVEFWDYEELLAGTATSFARSHPLEALQWVCDLMNKVLRGLSDSAQAIDAHALIWRPSIADSEQNSPNDVLNCLIEAVRDTAEALVTRDGNSALGILEGYDLLTFQRIALYLRGSHAELDPEGTERLITDPVVLRRSVLRHEVFYVLEHVFQSLSDDARNTYLSFVDALDDRRQQHLFLWPIRGHLADSRIADFRRLEDEFGALEHPDYSVFHQTEWVGPTSPYSTEDMLRMSTEELVAVLNKWEFKGGVDVPEPEGLARELANVAAKSPARISGDAEVFEKLNQPTYVRGIVQGLAAAAKAEEVISWEPVIHLCKWAVNQPRGDGPEGKGLEEFDTTWGQARKQIAWLLQRGMEKSAVEIPYELRRNVWSILGKLVEDPDPTLEEEAARAGYEDPSTTAINTVRGVALGAVFSYAQWVTRHNPGATRSWRSYGLDDVKSAVESRLSDLSPAVRSLLGKWLPLLFWLDEEWTRANIERILPLGKSSAALWEAAWQAYLMFASTLYIEFLTLLRASYDRALEVLGSSDLEASRPANPDERFGGHLLLFYREGVLSREDPLFLGFFQKAASDLRRRVMVDAARAVQDIPGQKREEAVQRLQELWEWRCGEVLDGDGDDHRELSSFSWWFLKDDFPPEWRLRQLEWTQKHGVKLEVDGLVLEKLVALCEADLPGAVACLEAIVGNRSNEHWGLYEDRVKAVLRKGLASPDLPLRARSVDLVHHIGSLGFLSFRELLEGQRDDGRGE